jgi:hypothetical protein
MPKLYAARVRPQTSFQSRRQPVVGLKHLSCAPQSIRQERKALYGLLERHIGLCCLVSVIFSVPNVVLIANLNV